MRSNHSRTSLCFLSVCLFAASLFLQASAQESDPNPDSPTPVLLSEQNSTRALAVSAKGFNGSLPAKYESRAFNPGRRSKIVLFVTNLDLLPDEGANAFKVYIEDENNTEFRMRVLDIQKVANSKNVYALTTVLFDDLGYWGQPQPKGDVLASVSWRGLVSNRVRLGLGTIGGGIKDDAGAVPTPSGVASASKYPERSPNLVGPKWSGDRFRFLQQATFGPTADLDNRIRRIGIRTWLAEQFEASYPTFPYPNIPFKPVNAPTDCDNNQTIPDVPVTCFRDTYTQYHPQNWSMQEAFYGEAQLKHRVSHALSQIWVTSGVDIQQSSHMIEYHKILSKNAFGNWRTLMKEMTLSPTMGDYLDMIRSTRNSPNENYAREVLQLFNIGLFKLNMDGTVQTVNGVPVDSYDQATVNNFTKVLTGWGFCNNAALCPGGVPGTLNFKDPMLLVPNNHDITAKTLFTYPGSTTTNIAACAGCTGTALTTYANNSLEQSLDNIFYHPNVPPFVSRILIQQLVTGEPSGAYVQRVANVFANNGSNVRGDLKAVITAILLDPEARGNVKTDPRYGKLREPILFATNILRNFNVKSSDGLNSSDGVIATQLAAMGQNPFRSPTVFNYYPPDYLVPGTTLNSPEFAILNTSTAVQRANFVNLMVYSRINGGSVNIPLGTSINFADMQAFATADPSGNQLLDALNNKMMGGTMSAATRATILPAINVPAMTAASKTQAAIYLVATSSQFQVQR